MMRKFATLGIDDTRYGILPVAHLRLKYDAGATRRMRAEH